MTNSEGFLVEENGTRPGIALQSNEKSRQAMRNLAVKMADEKAVRIEIQDIPISAEEARGLLHELRVHQIELEMQNGELRQTQVELDASRARYYDLFDLAPAGYMTVSEAGIIVESNLTAANILDTPRSSLTRQPLSRFFIRKDQDAYYIYRNKLRASSISVACELQMQTMKGNPFRGRLEGIAHEGADGVMVFRIILSDVTSFRPL